MSAPSQRVSKVGSPGAASFELVILIPIYNDWDCAKLLLPRLDGVVGQETTETAVILIDDCSSCPAPADLVASKLKHLRQVQVLRLRRNLGHQRAIAVGLSHVFSKLPCDAVLIMDGDGEDQPEDIPRLIRHFRQQDGRKVVFAERVRRSENRTFRVSYWLYRWLHRLLTGIAVRVGNFSIISADHLATLVVVSDLWNHYAASVFKARLPHDLLPTVRGTRLAGNSKLNYVGLVLHGLSAISVFAEIVCVRLSLAITGIIGLLLALVGTVVGIRFGTNLAIPGWATTATGLLLIIVLQMITVVAGMTLSILYGRNHFSFLPLRDYSHFVGEIKQAYGKTG